MAPTFKADELKIMAAALPVVEAVPANQDECWPGDPYAHNDEHCDLGDHVAASAAVAANAIEAAEEIVEEWREEIERWIAAGNYTPTAARTGEAA
jgi:hypothetical protein